MYQNPQSMFNPYSQNIAIIKDYFKKPIVLATAIISAVVAIISFATTIFSTPYILKLVKFTGEISGENLVYSIDPSSTVISAVIPVLTVVAFFIIYTKSKNTDPFSNPVNGVSILSVVSLIQMILGIFSCAGILGVTSLLFFSSLGAIYPELLVTYITMAVVIIFMLVFLISQYMFYKNVKRGLTSIMLSTKGAGAFGITNIIYSVISVISGCILLIPLFLDNSVLTPPDTTAVLDLKDITPLFIMSSIITLFTAAQYILIAIIALGYKKYINKIANTFNYAEQPFISQPVYTQTPFNAVTTTQPTDANMPQTYPMPAKEENLPLEISANEKTPFDKYRPSSNTKTCPFCKKQLPEEIIFCDSCGNKVQ